MSDRHAWQMFFSTATSLHTMVSLNRPCGPAFHLKTLHRHVRDFAQLLAKSTLDHPHVRIGAQDTSRRRWGSRCRLGAPSSGRGRRSSRHWWLNAARRPWRGGSRRRPWFTSRCGGGRNGPLAVTGAARGRQRLSYAARPVVCSTVVCPRHCSCGSICAARFFVDNVL